jgi:uncharacterized membrane-anchored protein YitT (DUF2179 family)
LRLGEGISSLTHRLYGTPRLGVSVCSGVVCGGGVSGIWQGDGCTDGIEAIGIDVNVVLPRSEF